jgi:hypothetical protein
MSITFTGNNLNIAILANQNFNHGWMTFACWYSIHHNLPEAKVYFKIEKKEGFPGAFAWTTRCSIKRIYEPIQDSLVVPCHFMAVKEYSSENLFSKCTDGKNSTFADYSVCGKFSLEECTNIPFWSVEQFMTKNLTLKEKKILDLWVKMQLVFPMLQDDVREDQAFTVLQSGSW